MEGRHFEPLNLDTYKNKSLTAESMEIAKTIMNNIISSNTLTAAINFGNKRNILENRHK
jgi:hypothetical protein